VKGCSTEERTEGFSKGVYILWLRPLVGASFRVILSYPEEWRKLLIIVYHLEFESTTTYRTLIFLSTLDRLPIADRGHTTYENQS